MYHILYIIKAGLTDYLIPFQKYVCVKPLFIMNISSMGLERKVEWTLGTLHQLYNHRLRASYFIQLHLNPNLVPHWI